MAVAGLSGQAGRSLDSWAMAVAPGTLGPGTALSRATVHQVDEAGRVAAGPGLLQHLVPGGCELRVVGPPPLGTTSSHRSQQAIGCCWRWLPQTLISQIWGSVEAA